jgi:hypothetical protein
MSHTCTQAFPRVSRGWQNLHAPRDMECGNLHPPRGEVLEAVRHSRDNAHNRSEYLYRACNDACVPSTATTQAAIESQAACGTFCCTQLKRCLTSHQCDIGTIIVINCLKTQEGGRPPLVPPKRSRPKIERAA